MVSLNDTTTPTAGQDPNAVEFQHTAPTPDAPRVRTRSLPLAVLEGNTGMEDTGPEAATPTQGITPTLAAEPNRNTLTPFADTMDLRSGSEIGHHNEATTSSVISGTHHYTTQTEVVPTLDETPHEGSDPYARRSYSETDAVGVGNDNFRRRDTFTGALSDTELSSLVAALGGGSAMNFSRRERERNREDQSRTH